MLKSMTAFASGSTIFRSSDLEVELLLEMKSVNSKFLDLQIRSPRLYNHFDRDFGQWVRAKLQRGRVDVYVHRRVIKGQSEEVLVNQDQARVLFESLDSLRKSLKIAEPVTIKDLLQNPDWLETRESTMGVENEKAVLQELFEKVLQDLVKERENEGRSLKKVLEDQLNQFEAIFFQFCDKSAEVVEALRKRLKERIELIAKTIEVEPQRLEQEVVVWVARTDFQEEVDRLKHHLKSLRDLLNTKQEAGRKIEFVLQEMHRELNTLGSKASDMQITNQVIDLKSFVERMKEQSMNVE